MQADLLAAPGRVSPVDLGEDRAGLGDERGRARSTSPVFMSARLSTTPPESGIAWP